MKNEVFPKGSRKPDSALTNHKMERRELSPKLDANFDNVDQASEETEKAEEIKLVKRKSNTINVSRDSSEHDFINDKQ